MHSLQFGHSLNCDTAPTALRDFVGLAAIKQAQTIGFARARQLPDILLALIRGASSSLIAIQRTNSLISAVRERRRKHSLAPRMSDIYRAWEYAGACGRDNPVSAVRNRLSTSCSPASMAVIFFSLASFAERFITSARAISNIRINASTSS